VDAVRTNQQFALRAVAIREVGDDAPGVLLEAAQVLSSMVLFGRQSLPQRSIDAVPGCSERKYWNLGGYTSGFVQPNSRPNLRNGAPAKLDPCFAQNRSEFATRAEARPASAQIGSGALEDANVPTNGPEQMRGEQAAKRSTDDKCSWWAQVRLFAR
jgi:hypothetical protein